MPNRTQYVRQIAAVLTACGLIVSLLAGLAAAQDLSTVEGRAAWLTEQFRGAPIDSNATFAAVTAMARLAQNADAAEVISSITQFYANGRMRRPVKSFYRYAKVCRNA